MNACRQGTRLKHKQATYIIQVQRNYNPKQALVAPCNWSDQGLNGVMMLYHNIVTSSSIAVLGMLAATRRYDCATISNTLYMMGCHTDPSASSAKLAGYCTISFTNWQTSTRQDIFK